MQAQDSGVRTKKFGIRIELKLLRFEINFFGLIISEIQNNNDLQIRWGKSNLLFLSELI